MKTPLNCVCEVSDKFSGASRGPDAAAEDGTAVDTTAKVGTAEDTSPGICRLGSKFNSSSHSLTSSIFL